MYFTFKIMSGVFYNKGEGEAVHNSMGNQFLYFGILSI